MSTPTKSVVAILAVVAFGLLGLAGTQVYEGRTSRESLEARFKALEEQIRNVREGNQSWASEITAEINAVHNRINQISEDSQETADSVRKEQARNAATLRQSMDDHARAVAAQQEKAQAQIRQTVDARIGGALKVTTTQIGELAEQVGRVNDDVDATRMASRREIVDVSDNLRSDLMTNRQEVGREIGLMRDTLGRQIAHNAEELEILKRGGERDIWEFDLRKAQDMVRIAGIGLQLTGTDTKGKKYDVSLRIDDIKVQKKGQLLNEPLQFLAGSQPRRYEMVVNAIDNDRVRGYLSATKLTATANRNAPLPNLNMN